MSSRQGRIQAIGRTRRQFARCNSQGAIQEAEEAAAREAKHWEAMAPSLGFCPRCGAHVDEAKGKLHDGYCIPGQPSRCQPGQNS